MLKALRPYNDWFVHSLGHFISKGAFVFHKNSDLVCLCKIYLLMVSGLTEKAVRHIFSEPRRMSREPMS